MQVQQYRLIPVWVLFPTSLPPCGSTPCPVLHPVSLPQKHVHPLPSEPLSQRAAVDLLELCQKLTDLVHCMHCADRVHGDLSLGNVLLDEDDVPYLIDLGLTQRQGDDTSTTQRLWGTPHFIAPEIAENCGRTEYSDLFALGVLLEQVMANAPDWSGRQKFIGRVVEPLKNTESPASRPLTSKVAADLRELRSDLRKDLVKTQDEEEACPPAPWQRANPSSASDSSVWLIQHVMTREKDRLRLQNLLNASILQGHGGKWEFHVKKVECVQNPWIWERYCSQQASMRHKWEHATSGLGRPERHPPFKGPSQGQHPFEDALDAESNELFLFHGTTSAKVAHIVHGGFNEKMAHPNALYGRGIYFTPEVCTILIPTPCKCWCSALLCEGLAIELQFRFIHPCSEDVYDSTQEVTCNMQATDPTNPNVCVWPLQRHMAVFFHYGGGRLRGWLRVRGQNPVGWD